MKTSGPLMQPDCHHQILSVLASELSDIRQQLQSRASSSNVAISGGTHNTAGRDINNFNYYLNQNSPRPARFEGLAMALKFVDQQVQPQAGGILGNVHQILSNLSNLVEMSSKVYEALEDSELGNRVRSTIDARITQCTDTLTRAHQQLVYHYFLRCSWDHQEPEHVASIRKELSIEAQRLFEWLSSLQVFCWARHLLSKPQSQFAWEMLNTFFSTRRDMMKDIHIERITVLEPLQGKGLTIPLRFISSLKDLHMVIHLACQGTTSSRYIEGHSYDLEDAYTNKVVGEENFQVSVEDGKVFEVAILMKGESTDIVGCPKCGEEQGGHGAEGGWVRCAQCHTQFIRHESNSRTTRIEDVNQDDDKGSTVNGLNEQGPSDDDRHAYLFRRMKIEIFLKPQAIQESHTGLTSGGTVTFTQDDNTIFGGWDSGGWRYGGVISGNFAIPPFLEPQAIEESHTGLTSGGNVAFPQDNTIFGGWDSGGSRYGGVISGNFAIAPRVFIGRGHGSAPSGPAALRRGSGGETIWGPSLPTSLAASSPPRSFATNPATSIVAPLSLNIFQDPPAASTAPSTYPRGSPSASTVPPAEPRKPVPTGRRGFGGWNSGGSRYGGGLSGYGRGYSAYPRDQDWD
ncbi:hypothetical protein BKA70DRAFT_1575463 [Coprinopsis sp. MPI-PUGE-AT-0042]|nr:hypothetical protein BKA70DRAFT_1575463 [Coprinopsis sp. MPI-PUGE-AT-0042]